MYTGHSLCGPGDGWLNGLAAGGRGEREDGHIRVERSYHPNQTGHDSSGAASAPVVGAIDWSNLELR